MDVIIEHILYFLQFDVAKIFGKGSDCCLCCMSASTPHFTESVENCISNVYEPRPQITNGDDEDNQWAEFCAELGQSEEDNECRRESRQKEVSSDDCMTESESLLDNLKAEPQRDENDEEEMADANECTCEAVCKQVVSKIADKCSSSTLLELQCIEERATKLWDTLNLHMRNNPSGKFPNWWDLKSWQKLPFYWAALSNEILCEDPFENFKRFYVVDKKSNKRSAKRQLERTLIMWHRLSAKQRLPFIMEAFISKVGSGKVNISDEHEIQRIICELQNK
ncbi:PREDICTED: uncharacterized protein LOC108382393 [Rhagoletis zephyria]|uniref:uncharacterized protein LOC108382393 n=1 Tax=Rhagoletis zephyria TaxID=28612 RepID=UPI0008117E09|nr:PREDICTED: uncharacterized protein LOC108382393 [Rhagoletis zephyria]